MIDQVMIDQVMKSSSYRDPKMEAYCRKFDVSRTSFTASSSTTLHADIMKPPMNS
jgi:hypothetical protein